MTKMTIWNSGFGILFVIWHLSFDILFVISPDMSGGFRNYI